MKILEILISIMKILISYTVWYNTIVFLKFSQHLIVFI